MQGVVNLAVIRMKAFPSILPGAEKKAIPVPAAFFLVCRKGKGEKVGMVAKPAASNGLPVAAFFGGRFLSFASGRGAKGRGIVAAMQKKHGRGGLDMREYLQMVLSEPCVSVQASDN